MSPRISVLTRATRCNIPEDTHHSSHSLPVAVSRVSWYSQKSHSDSRHMAKGLARYVTRREALHINGMRILDGIIKM
jgi:hypothetical protein